MAMRLACAALIALFAFSGAETEEGGEPKTCNTYVEESATHGCAERFVVEMRDALASGNQEDVVEACRSTCRKDAEEALMGLMAVGCEDHVPWNPEDGEVSANVENAWEERANPNETKHATFHVLPTCTRTCDAKASTDECESSAPLQEGCEEETAKAKVRFPASCVREVDPSTLGPMDVLDHARKPVGEDVEEWDTTRQSWKIDCLFGALADRRETVADRVACPIHAWTNCPGQQRMRGRAGSRGCHGCPILALRH